VLDGRVNRMKLLPLGRWIGGVHLTAGMAPGSSERNVDRREAMNTEATR
jgi:hypothetical protein